MSELGYYESVGGLIRGIMADVRQLMREEIALARVEMREQAQRAKLAAIALGTAAVALAIGGVFLLISVAVGIADLLDWPVWTGFFIVALVLCVTGMVMLSTGRKRLSNVRPVPEQTMQSLKENSEWIAKRLSSVKR